jgi:phospholipid N-methyltransferase
MLQQPAVRKPRSTRNLTFFKGFLRQPGSVGSVIPSSRFLEQRIVNMANIANAKTVVEFGPGTGGTTQAMLHAMPSSARLLAIDLDPIFVSLLNAHHDKRLIAHHGSAEKIAETLEAYQLSAPDVVVSGIPFSTMPQEVGNRILQAVWSSLRPGGAFLAYQFRSQVSTLGTRLFGKPEVEVEFLNAPPMRLYRWQKPE